MNKRLKAGLLTLAGFAMLSAVGLYVFRIHLAETVISAQLNKQGIPVQSFSVAEVSFNSLLLRNLEMGADRTLQADTILVTWRLRDLLAGTVDFIQIGGLQASLDLSGEKPPLGSLQPMISPSEGEDATPLKLPAISLLDSAIHVRSAWEDVVISLRGDIEPAHSGTQIAHFIIEFAGPSGQAKSTFTATLDNQGNIQGKITVSEGRLSLHEAEIPRFTGNTDFAFAAMHPQHIKAEFMLADIRLPGNGLVEQVFEQAKLSLQMDETNVQLTSDLLSSDGSFVAHLHATMRNYLDAPDFDLLLNTSGLVNQYPWRLLGLAQPNKGSVALTTKVSGQTPPIPALRRNSIDWLQHTTLTGQAQLELQQFSYLQKISNLTGKLRLDLTLAKGNGKLDLHADGKKMAIGTLVGRRATIDLPMYIGFDQDTLRLSLRKEAKIKLDKIDPIDTVTIKSPINLSISQADIEMIKKSQGQILKHHLVVSAAPIILLIEQEKAQPIETQIYPGKITLSGKLDADKPYQGQGVINDAGLTLPQSHLQLDNFAATLHLGAARTDKIADFSIDRLHHRVPKPYFAPFSLSGSIKRKSVQGETAVYSMHASGGIPTSSYLSLTGEHALDSGVGMLKIAIAPLEFIPGSLQPEALIPAFAQLENVNGIASASAQFRWSKKGLRSSSGMLNLDDISFVHQATEIRGLSATLNLTDLLSPASPPQQILTIRRIDPGIPMESLVVSYQIEGTPPQIDIKKASLFLLGGIVSLKPTVIDPASARNDMVIHVDNLDLEAVFNQMQVEGLTGYGRLDGSIPITLEDDQVTIRNSHLMSEIPGTLHFQSEKASQLLAGAGEEMDLLLQALQDFHYTELSLKLDKSAAHDLKATLSLLGNNPSVQEGQMFRLNINLESNIGKILEAIGQGHKLSNEILRELFRLH